MKMEIVDFVRRIGDLDSGGGTGDIDGTGVQH